MSPSSIRVAGEIVDAGMLSVEGVACLIGVSQRTIFRYVESGRLPQPQRFGRLIRWNKDQIIAALSPSH